MSTTQDRPAGDDTLVGTLLDGRYQVTGLIGRGGVATVYRATDRALGRDVAVKVFRGAEGLDDPERRKSETALLASLAHPALVTLHDAVHEPGTGREFLVMELVPGPNLRERLDSAGPLDAREAADMTVELAEALHVIHSRGIVHRDVKPANVLLAPSPVPTRPWRAKLADFGIARLVDDAHLTMTGGLIGTPHYLAPEQVRGEGAAAASDIYALGLLLVESRTARPVFPGPALEAASARLTRDPELPGFLGTDWRELLAAMLARDPGDRPTALDVALRAAALGPDQSPDAPTERSAGGDTDPLATAAWLPADAPAEPVDRHKAGRPPADDHTAMLRAADLDDGGTAATVLLPGPAGATTAHPAASGERTQTGTVGAEAEDRGRIGSHSAAADASRHGSRPAWLIPLGAVALLVAAAAIVLPMVFAGMGDDAAQPTPTPIPSVPGELGVHLEELEEAVTP